ncbi:putative protein aminotransferase, class V [Pyrococcus sp. NA2]|uniref:aminotransferase class V-fold PLP-dependent enzyme n=1 Tax=Pyrococcus sp. (strain NA2) TaxID=342949 RepID=UPI000209A93B|nr:aminotransferase class V-fold PLP-dependent enzyme [Pyrococcus sp. NA2]AEC52485.1 putative protein aminotransferase, class V [Pyrococcus sp. NA2]
MDRKAIRKLFPIVHEEGVAYFASCSYGPLSEPVKNAILNYIEDWERKGMNWDFWMEKYEELRKEAAFLLGAHKDEIALVPNVTSGLIAVANSLNYDGKKVVLSDLNFPTVGHVWLAQEKRGARVEFVKGRNWSISLEDIERAVDDDTLVLSEPHVCYQSGFKYHRVKELSEIAHEHGALFILDDAQSTGVIDIDVKKEDVDVLVTTTLKYLLGGAGLGIMYIRRELVEELEPTVTGWFGQENPFAFDIYHLNYAGNARRFETGSPAVPTVITSLEAIKLIKKIDPKKIESHVLSLVSYATELGEEMGLDILSPRNPENMGPMFVFKVNNPHGIAEELLREKIVVSPRGPAIRVAMHIFNSENDVERLFEFLKRYGGGRVG